MKRLIRHSARRPVRCSRGVDISEYKYVDTRDGYEIYQKTVKGKGRWAAQDQDKNCEPFEITYEQARGIDPITCAEDIDDDIVEDMEQEYTSKDTSINVAKAPAVFKLVKTWSPDTINLDYGGGRADTAQDYLNEFGVTNLVYDPYNRSAEHNQNVIRQVKDNGGADTATCSNVLNVIKEPAVRLNVLQNIRKLVKPSGTVYITVYEGSGRGDEGPTKAGYQLNRKTADYLEEIQQVFPDATRKGKLIVAHPSGSAITSATEVDIDGMEDKLYKQLEEAVFSYMQDEGFEDPKEWSVVEVNDTDDGRVKAEVRAEISYDGMWKLKSILDPIVQQYDSYAYFDMEDSGIMNAYIDVFHIYSAVGCATNTCNMVVSPDTEDMQEITASFEGDERIEVDIDEPIEVGGGLVAFVNEPPIYETEVFDLSSPRGDRIRSRHTDADLAITDDIYNEVMDILQEHLPEDAEGRYQFKASIIFPYNIDGLGEWFDDYEEGATVEPQVPIVRSVSVEPID